MTSTTEAAWHPDVAEISDLTEGLLPPDRSAEIRQHLDGCDLCSDVHASLEEIRELLGAVPAPPRMPTDVAARIDAALAAEALPAPTVDGRVSRETSLSPDRPVGRPNGATGPGRKGRHHARSRRRTVLGAVLTTAVLGAGALVLQTLGNGGTDSTAHGKTTPPTSAFSGHSVQSQVKDLLTTEKVTHPSERPRSGVGPDQNSPGSTPSANTLLQSQPSVPDCVRKAINGSGVVLGAKTGTYAGKSAYLVVLPAVGDTKRVTAYVVTAACVSRQPDSVGTVLLEKSYPRP